MGERVRARIFCCGGRCAERCVVRGRPVLPVAPMMRIVGAISLFGGLGLGFR